MTRVGVGFAAGRSALSAASIFVSCSHSARSVRVDTPRAVSGNARGPGSTRWHLGVVRRARVLDGRGDHGVPDDAGQRWLGCGERVARLVVDAVVGAGEAL